MTTAPFARASWGCRFGAVPTGATESAAAIAKNTIQLVYALEIPAPRARLHNCFHTAARNWGCGRDGGIQRHRRPVTPAFAGGPARRTGAPRRTDPWTPADCGRAVGRV